MGNLCDCWKSAKLDLTESTYRVVEIPLESGKYPSLNPAEMTQKEKAQATIYTSSLSTTRNLPDRAPGVLSVPTKGRVQFAPLP